MIDSLSVIGASAARKQQDLHGSARPSGVSASASTSQQLLSAQKLLTSLPKPVKASSKHLPNMPAAVAANVPCRMEALPNGCSLNMMLLVETVADRVMRWMLPINVLRNYALLGADTRLVAMVDVDLLPSVGLAEWLEQPGK
jgi:hypothetical protein